MEIDYDDLIFSERYKLDQKAYAKYFNEKGAMTYNKWYGTEMHKRYITPLLRKYKLEKIKKADL